MSREILIQIYNTLTQVEIKGYENIDKMCGVLYALRAELDRPQMQDESILAQEMQNNTETEQ